jgi:hypothetical protein
MKTKAATNFILSGGMFPNGIREASGLLFSRRARRAVHGLVLLRRAYEHVLVMATLEGVRPIRRSYYDDYVDALNILGAKAVLIAKTL